MTATVIAAVIMLAVCAAWVLWRIARRPSPGRRPPTHTTVSREWLMQHQRND